MLCSKMELLSQSYKTIHDLNKTVNATKLMKMFNNVVISTFYDIKMPKFWKRRVLV